ncbi:Lectin-related protein [Gryllus bimaculatus]|nr:Lectin-related protein [Gryllus bimaculatus]
MPARSLQVPVVVALTMCSISAANLDPMAQLECACTSTHFVDVRFAIKCWRNSTRVWTNPKTSDDFGTFTEQSTIQCKREKPPPLDADYEVLPNVGFYKFHPRQTTWEDALRTCASEGGNLAVVNSEAEAESMAVIFSNYPRLNDQDWLNDQAWIGVTDLKTEGVFLSLRGLTLQEEGWARWEKGQPNNEGDGEHCVVFNRDKELTDEPCDTKLSFFCERPFVK